MRIIRLFSVIALCTGLMTGCSKQESSTPPQAPEAPTAAPKATAEVQKQAEAAQSAAQTAASAASSQAQSMIDQAKSLIADNKYAEAADLLKRLSSMQLTPEQKKLVDDLMAQVQKAMAGAAASDATKSVGGLLGK